ncbi:MFS transporter [Fodinicola acaciae]|uniref:MFS transporter n=1 Tax=Fodinicola acaciae TaxID=2681555 RepID=UPI0013D20CAA|nr:MFS transporter [Fodinicola acaciae]
MSVTTDRPASYAEVLANPTFRVLFGSRTLAIAADTLRIVALSVLVYGVTGSPLLAAVTYGIGFLPQVIGSSLFGALSDRLPPRGLIVAGYALECGGAIALGLLPMPVWASLTLVGAIACLTPIFGSASARLTADVLPGDAYVLARSLTNMASSVAQLAGLAIGGLTVGAIGGRHALLVCAGCHLFAAITVYFGLSRFPAPAPKSGSLMRESWGGNLRLLADPWVRTLLLAHWLPSGIAVGAEGLIIPYAAQRGFPPGAAGVLLACLPVGMLVGNLLVGRFVRPRLRERLVPALVALCGAPLIFLIFSPSPLIMGILLVVSALGFSHALGLQARFRDAVDPAVRGQAFGLLTTGMMTAQGVGPGVFGAVAEIVPTSVAMALSGTAVVFAAFWLWPALRSVPR